MPAESAEAHATVYWRAGCNARITTRAGRVGALSDRKSRTTPRSSQNGHAIGSVSNSGRAPGATGASHRRQARVPVPSTLERIDCRFSSTAGRGRAPKSPPECDVSPIPRMELTSLSVGGDSLTAALSAGVSPGPRALAAKAQVQRAIAPRQVSGLVAARAVVVESCARRPICHEGDTGCSVNSERRR